MTLIYDSEEVSLMNSATSQALSKNDPVSQAKRSRSTELIDKHCRCSIRRLLTEDECFQRDVDSLWKEYLNKPFLVFDEGLEKGEFISRLIQFNRENQLILGEKLDEKTNDLQLIGIGMVCPVGNDIEPHVIYFKNASPRDMLCAMITFLKTARKNYQFENGYFYSHEWTKNIHDRCCQYGLFEFVKTIPEQNYREKEYLYKLTL